ncbi:VIT1/CCC1 transporter family protein [Niabella hirudinis]|uniref:VIT1/CCC1 transporter family protein n=1 Tax=Niabella hirudinis TaxID=1285929 RepID=UPI003EB78303
MSKIITHYFSSVLIGIIDGIIIPLTVFCFLSGLGRAPSDAWDFTLYATLTTAILLAASGFFTRKEELSHTHDKKILDVYKGLDVADHIKADLIEDARRESSEWGAAWNDKAAPDTSLPPISYALFIFAGCLTGGLIVLLNARKYPLPGYLFFLIPTIILVVAGFIKYRLFGRPVWGGVVLTAGGGMLAALGAYWIGTLL